MLLIRHSAEANSAATKKLIASIVAVRIHPDNALLLG